MEYATYDVVVIGGGNAGLAAAVSAKDSGAARVLLIEKAPHPMRGGDTFYAAGGLRFGFDSPAELAGILGPDVACSERGAEMAVYTRDDFRRELLAVSNGRADQELVDLVVEQSRPTVEWMAKVGRIPMRMAPAVKAATGANSMRGGSVVQVIGDGPNLIDRWLETAERLGIEVSFGAGALDLVTDGGRVTGVLVRFADGVKEVPARSVVLASGGFAANVQMRAQHLGPDMAGAIVRGTPHNQGDGLRMAFAVGAMPAGQWNGFHCSPVSADWGDFTPRDLPASSRRASYIYGIMLNRDGLRFVDEGADTALQTYSRVTRAILQQPGAIAWQIFDSKVHDLLGPAYGSSTPIMADSVEGLVQNLQLNDDCAAIGTISAYNAASQGRLDGFDPSRLDGYSTQGLTPRKSNWALRIDAPPYYAYKVGGGITWTYGGLKVQANGQVVGTDWRPIPGLYCCGEMVGGVFFANFPSGTGYLGGAGLVFGAVFGKIAGASAARSAG